MCIYFFTNDRCTRPLIFSNNSAIQNIPRVCFVQIIPRMFFGGCGLQHYFLLALSLQQPNELHFTIDIRCWLPVFSSSSSELSSPLLLSSIYSSFSSQSSLVIGIFAVYMALLLLIIHFALDRRFSHSYCWYYVFCVSKCY